MNLCEFLEEKTFEIMGILFLMVLSGLYLKVCGNPFSVILYLLLLWAAAVSGKYIWEYWRQKRKYQSMWNLMENLREKYLICELLKKPDTQLEKVYYDMVKAANKSMVERIEEVQRISREYKEYIEEWIHEVKTPIAAGDLICSNYPSPESRRMKKEIQRIGELVEQVLYYARSEQVEKDYFIAEHTLAEVVKPALLSHRSYILEKGTALKVEELSEPVYTDSQWVGYILGQILSNAVKYQDKENPKIHIYSLSGSHRISLCVEDNGRGIPAEDLPRIFDKGFTGSDRQKNRATGLGLYLCKKLCDRLGMGIRADSTKGEGTVITLDFPVGSMHRM